MGWAPPQTPPPPPADGVIDDIDFLRVKKRLDAFAPAPKPRATAAAADGRIANNVERGQCGVGGGFNGDFRRVHNRTLVFGGKKESGDKNKSESGQVLAHRITPVRFHPLQEGSAWARAGSSRRAQPHSPF